MLSAFLYNQTVAANVATFDVIGCPAPGDVNLWTLAISLETVTPGTGTLLATLTYFDGAAVQTLNVSLGLTAGNAITFVFPEIWSENYVDNITFSLTYIAGGVSGTCQVRLAY